MSSETDMNKFYETIYDEDLNDYIDGNYIVNIKKKNLTKKEEESMNMSLIIDYHFNKYNIENTNKNIQTYINMYKKIVENNYIIVKKYQIPFHKTEEGIEYDKEIKENDDYENNKKLHYQQYFMRYKDIDYIVEYYNKMLEEYENKEYYLEDNDSHISENESYISDIDDYIYDEINNEYYEDEEYYDNDEYY